MGGALTAGRGPWQGAGRLDVELVVQGVAPPVEGLEGPEGLEGRERREPPRVRPALACCMGDAWTEAVILPRLRDRPEDFRAMLTDCLAREGLRIVGRPLGIDTSAYA